MSASDITWRRLLYAGVVLSLLNILIVFFFVVLRVKYQEGIEHGGDWFIIGVQLLSAFVLYVLAYLNKRDSSITKTLLIIICIISILMGLLIFLAIAQETNITMLWKAMRVVGFLELIISVISFYSWI